MRQKSSKPGTSRGSGRFAAQRNSQAGDRAAALTPPGYGIDFVDRRLPALAPVQRMPEDEPPEEVAAALQWQSFAGNGGEGDGQEDEDENAVIQGKFRPGAAPRSTVVQRLCGFEAELSVPTMPPAPDAVKVLGPGAGGGPPTRHIEGFLAGGLPYGVPQGGNANFTLTADHNVLMGRHRGIRTALDDLGYKLPPLAHEMSNLEYVTPPLNELAANSTTAFRTQFAAIARHAAGLFPKVQDQMFPVPGTGGRIYTGIPMGLLQRWLGADFHDEDVLQAIGDFRDAIRDSFYLQATVGIIPSALGDLHKKRAPWVRAGNALEDVEDRIHATVKALLKSDNFKRHPFVRELKRRRRIDYQALVGLLYLIFSYMVGDAINQTTLIDATDKNAVMFMSKMTSLGAIIRTAVPAFLRLGAAGLPAAVVPADLVAIITNHFNANPATTVAFWTGRPRWGLAASPGRAPIINPANLATFVRDVLTGQNVVTAAAPGPGPAGAAPRTFAAPDAMTIATGGQGGVQVEYRHIKASPSSAGTELADELMKVVREARKLNTKHMGYWARRSVLKAADG